MKKIYAISLTALTVAGLLAAGAGATYAATTGTGTNKPLANLIEKLSTRFSLNATDIQQVFDEERQQMQEQRQTDMQARQKERLDTAVTDGTITQAQEDLILAKHDEIQAFHEGLRDMDATERGEAIKTHIASLKAWAEANGIPERFLPMGGGMGGGRGEGRGMGLGQGQMKGMGMHRGQAAPTDTQ
ncbi:MAG: hypothetical protein V1745_02850 [Patescibacteria group bacterium]